MRIVILTTGLHGVASHHLKKLVEVKDVEIVSVIYNANTKVDVKKSRKRQVEKIKKIGLLGALNGIRMRQWYQSGIHKYLNIVNLEEICREYTLPFFRVESIQDPLLAELIGQQSIDLGLSLGNGYIPKRIFSLPRLGMLNIHHEELPAYQNAQSVLWQLYNKSKHTGYTIHQITSKIDEGDILYQEQVPIQFKDSLGETVSATYALLFEKSVEGLSKVLSDFDYFLSNSSPQGEGNKYTTPSLWQYLQIWINFQKLKKNNT
ncbi:formyltransferase family protein [Mongoliitalea lutea]|uniref:Formyl transferase N-terminal domain-containing protein n=1 Tax=Mongoliitalea lutea TaxID=849756 RepID=A0A8J3G4J9_9BACT|nr:formyltransferase family protein [Mongoliitalea lutea]GHB31300.1 hypothetical protein GCM10008106_10020 [Mongoliitalea lutea]